jgi:ketosteroid isomerase-like protein
MSAENNTEIVQKAYADFLHGDLPAVLNVFGEDILWISPGNSALSGEKRGKNEVAGFFHKLLELWEFLAFEPGEYIASGDRVVALGRYEVRSRQTGRTAATHWAMVWTFGGGKAIRFQEYMDTSALEAAELAVAAA